MKLWIILLRGFGFVWLILATLLIIVCTFMVWKEKGFWGVQELLSPFNFRNSIAMILTLAPGAGALALAEKLKNKIR